MKALPFLCLTIWMTFNLVGAEKDESALPIAENKAKTPQKQKESEGANVLSGLTCYGRNGIKLDCDDVQICFDDLCITTKYPNGKLKSGCACGDGEPSHKKGKCIDARLDGEIVEQCTCRSYLCNKDPSGSPISVLVTPTLVLCSLLISTLV